MLPAACTATLIQSIDTINIGHDHGIDSDSNLIDRCRRIGLPACQSACARIRAGRINVMHTLGICDGEGFANGQANGTGAAAGKNAGL